jgi:hypothetical protein
VKALTVAGDSPRGALPEVVPHMPAVGDLCRLWCAGCGAFREECAQPRQTISIPGRFASHAARAASRSGSIHRPTGLDVDEFRAVDRSFACGVLISPHRSRGRDCRFRQCVEQPQHRAAADAYPKRRGHPGAVGHGGTHMLDPGLRLAGEPHQGALRTAAAFTIPSSKYPNDTVQTRSLRAYLRWRNVSARRRDVLAAERKEHARLRCQKGIRWGGRLAAAD